MGRTARAVIGLAVMLTVAAPAIRQLPDAAVRTIRQASHSLTALQFPQEDRPYVPTGVARWQGCDPVPVLLNVPGTVEASVREALRTLSDAAGRDFTVVGTTDRIPTVRWPLDGQKAQPGDPYPAVIIAVAGPQYTDLLEQHWHAASIANPVGDRYVTGAVVIAEHALDRWPAGTVGLRRLILHELGHLAGLAHAREGTLMHAHVHDESPSEYTEADLAGIAAMSDCTGTNR